MAKTEDATIRRRFQAPLFFGVWSGFGASGPLTKQRGSLFGKRKGSKSKSKSKNKSKRESQKKKRAIAYPPADAIIIGGGGGGGSHGIPNVIIVAPCTNGISPEVFSLSTGAAAPLCAAMHPDGGHLVCALGDMLRVYDVHMQAPAKLSASTLQAKSRRPVGEISSLMFSADGAFLGMGGQVGDVAVLHWPTLEVKMVIKSAHAGKVSDLDFDPEGIVLSTHSSEDKKCYLWDCMTGRKHRELTATGEGPGAHIRSCRFSRQDDDVVYMGVNTRDKSLVVVWSISEQRPLARVTIHSAPMTAFAISRSGRFLASGSSEGDLAVVDVLSLTVKMHVKSAHSFFVSDLEFAPNDSALLSVSADASAVCTRLPKEHSVLPRLALLLALVVLLIALVIACILRYSQYMVKKAA